MIKQRDREERNGRGQATVSERGGCGAGKGTEEGAEAELCVSCQEQLVINNCDRPLLCTPFYFERTPQSL